LTDSNNTNNNICGNQWCTDWLHHWDFAVLEFSPSHYPGLTVGGYYGTSTYWSPVTPMYMLGYPEDKYADYPNQYAQPNMWGSGTGCSPECGINWTPPPPWYGIWSAQFYHVLDSKRGDSGACIYKYPEGWCFGINTWEWNDGTTYYNVGRKWDATTYSFFDTHGNWP
jgi:hypothetical protein